jgi:hypothetical protein
VVAGAEPSGSCGTRISTDRPQRKALCGLSSGKPSLCLLGFADRRDRSTYGVANVGVRYIPKVTETIGDERKESITIIIVNASRAPE